MKGQIAIVLRLLPFSLLLCFFLFIMYGSISRIEKDESLFSFTLLVLLISPVVFWCYRYLWRNRYNHLWSKGIFPINLKYNDYNLLEAYICLLGRMIQVDRADYREKMKYAANYFKQQFPATKYNFSSSLSYSLKNPIKLVSVTDWMNKHIGDEAHRIQILYFLFGISNVDGSINGYELRFLKRLSDLLAIQPKNFDSIYAMYQRKKIEPEPQTRSALDQLHQLSCQVLGLEITSDMELIKSAYRKMVKINHPDRFANDSAEQQALAHERFLQIQKAYEFLELKLA